MNRKQFLLVLVALGLIGGAGLVLLKRNQQSWNASAIKMGGKVLPNFRFNEVAAIHIQGSSEVNVVRQDGVWRVPQHGGYLANFHQVSDLLLKVKNLKVVQSEAVGPSQLARVELAEPGKGEGSGTLLEFKGENGKVLASLLVGKKHSREQNPSAPFGLRGLFDGRYILLPSDPSHVLLISDELASVIPEPAAWLSRDFFKAENIRSISLASVNPVNSWKVFRAAESSPWGLADSKPGETLDGTFAVQLAEMLPFATFVDVLPESSSHFSPNPSAVVTIETFDRVAYTLRIGARGSDGNYPLTVAVAADLPISEDKTAGFREKLAKEQKLSSWVYLAEPARIEPLIRDRAQILQPKTIAGEPAASASLQGKPDSGAPILATELWRPGVITNSVAPPKNQ